MGSNKNYNERYIKFNFLGLSYPKKIEILDIYNSDLSRLDVSYDYSSVFNKYMIVAKKLHEFKHNFDIYSDDDRKKMRNLIERCRTKINPNNSMKSYEISSYYNSLTVRDDVADNYIKDVYYTYDVSQRISIADDLFTYYGELSDFSFEDILGLFRCYKDFFNPEIKKLDHDFYPFYLRLNTVDRMKYIWHLAHFSMFNSADYDEELDETYGAFKKDDTYVETLHQGNFVPSKVKQLSPGRYAELCKRFKMQFL